MATCKAGTIYPAKKNNEHSNRRTVMAITQWQRGYYDGRNGRYLPEYPVTMYDGDNNTKAMQDYEAGYCAGCDSIELTLVPMEA